MNRAQKVMSETAQTGFCQKEIPLPSPFATRAEDEGKEAIGTGLERCG
jgi:hypothetical protein